MTVMLLDFLKKRWIILTVIAVLLALAAWLLARPDAIPSDRARLVTNPFLASEFDLIEEVRK
ncbi:MAG: hypothetical protein ACOX8I_00945 [Bacillota bacterium]|jgi:hypothetical protein